MAPQLGEAGPLGQLGCVGLPTYVVTSLASEPEKGCGCLDNLPISKGEAKVVSALLGLMAVQNKTRCYGVVEATGLGSVLRTPSFHGFLETGVGRQVQLRWSHQR